MNTIHTPRTTTACLHACALSILLCACQTAPPIKPESKKPLIEKTQLTTPTTTPSTPPKHTSANLVAGLDFTCTLSNKGHVHCWGDNKLGQLASNKHKGSLTPVRIELPGTATTITAGANHACASLKSGKLYCWGNNSGGQMAQPASKEPFTTATQIPKLSHIVSMQSKTYQTCALDRNGAIFCWGGDTFEQTNTHKTYKVEGMYAADEVAVGAFHACALSQKGTVWCWGRDGGGNLGITTQLFSPITSPSPLQIKGLANIKHLALGDNHSCALDKKGVVSCWGQNTNGQLGLDPNKPRASARPLPLKQLPTDIVQISAGANHTCALDKKGSVSCWGENYYGQLGSKDGKPGMMITVKDLPAAKSIVAGRFHTCATLADGKVKCWGNNQHGQLGNGQKTLESNAPQNIKNLKNVTNLWANTVYTCAQTASKQVQCWGVRPHYYGPRPTFDGPEEKTPTLVQSRAPRPMDIPKGTKTLVMGIKRACVLIDKGEVQCRDISNQFKKLKIPPAIGLMRPDTTCANHKDSVSCWTQSKYTSTHKYKIKTSSPLVTMEMGRSHVCLLSKKGQLQCTGDNRHGQLGNGTTKHNKQGYAPVQKIKTPVKDVALGETHSCALLTSGETYCWGGNEFGQLARTKIERSLTPLKLEKLPKATELSAARSHTCALLESGEVMCWGRYFPGANGTYDGEIETVKGLKDAVHLVSGHEHTCALRKTGEVSCWGSNEQGQFGTGVALGIPTPVDAKTP